MKDYIVKILPVVLLFLTIGHADNHYKDSIANKVEFTTSKIACHSGNSEECFNTAFNFEKGHGVKKNILESIKYYIKACDGGYDDGCYNLALIYQSGYPVGDKIVQRKSKAIRLFTRLCDNGDYDACSQLKFSYLHNMELKKLKKLKKVLKKMCFNENTDACYDVKILEEFFKDL